jgi:YggT family protein
LEAYLVSLVQLVITLITILIIAQALISFTPLAPWHPVRRTLDQLTEPILRPFRNLMPNTGAIDFSPMVALIVIQILGQIIVVFIRSAF